MQKYTSTNFSTTKHIKYKILFQKKYLLNLTVWTIFMQQYMKSINGKYLGGTAYWIIQSLC